MASPDSTFALTRATASDTLPTAALIYNSFDAFARENFFGIPTPTQIPLLAQEFATTMSADPADVWVKVTDDKTGEIVAASNWKIYLAPERALARVEDKPKAWVEDGEVRERMRALMGPMNERRARANLGAFMYLHILATHPSHRRLGLGSMMMQWGVDVADSLCLPGWIEASPEGNFLYKRFGFYDFEEIRREDEVLGRKREVLGRKGEVLGRKGEVLGRKGEVLGMCMRRDTSTTPVAVRESAGVVGGE